MPTETRTSRVLVAGFGLICLFTPSLALAQGAPATAQPPQRDGQGQGQGGDRQRGDRQPGDRGSGGGGGGGGFGGMRGLMGGGGGGNPMSPSIDSREMDTYSKKLTLTPEQKDLAKGLFEGYQEQFNAKATEMRDRLDKARQEARDSGDRSMFQTIGAQMNEFRVSRQKMEEQFFSDFKAILTPEQLTQWPTLERDRRRDKTMAMGRMSGERMDVVKLLDQAKVSDEARAQLKPILEQYAADLDRELVSRNKVYEEGFAKMAALRGDPADSQTELQKLLEKGRDASVKVRDINRRYARQIESALPEDQRPAWARAVKEASFPDVYRPSGTSRQITAAEGFSDLDAPQKESLKALKETYSRELDSVNDKLATAQEQTEMTITVQGMFQRFGGNGGPDDPTADIRQQKRDLEQRTAASLKKLLTPEQQDRLPADRGGGEGQGRRGGDAQGAPADQGGDRARPNRNNDGNAPRRPNRGGGGGGG